MSPNDLVAIPGGRFLMGQDDGRDEERPAPTFVTVPPFRIARYQVTNADYAAFRAIHLRRPALPATSVSWLDAVEILRVARRSMEPPGPPSYRGRMGIRRPRRPRTATLPVGQHLPEAIPAAARGPNPLASGSQRIRPLRHVPERARVVQRLVRTLGTIQSLPGTTARPATRSAPGLKRRRLAPSH
jgi:hypothetical protein